MKRAAAGQIPQPPLNRCNQWVLRIDGGHSEVGLIKRGRLVRTDAERRAHAHVEQPGRADRAGRRIAAIQQPVRRCDGIEDWYELTRTAGPLSDRDADAGRPVTLEQAAATGIAGTPVTPPVRAGAQNPDRS